MLTLTELIESVKYISFVTVEVGLPKNPETWNNL